VLAADICAARGEADLFWRRRPTCPVSATGRKPGGCPLNETFLGDGLAYFTTSTRWLLPSLASATPTTFSRIVVMAAGLVAGARIGGRFSSAPSPRRYSSHQRI